jgi:transposase-like protein
MAARIPLPASGASKLRALAAAGYTQADAAAEFGVSVATVKRWAGRKRISFHRGGRPDPLIRATVIDFIRLGYRSAAAIGRVMGRNRTLADRWVRDLIRRGLVRRTGRGPKTRLYLTEAWTGGG